MTATTQAEASAITTLELEPTENARSVPVVQQGGALAASSPAGIMLSALARGVSPADIREMLALQREWDADQARKSFNRAFAAFKAEAIRIVKAKKVGDGPLKGKAYAELFNVVDAVGPVLSAHGLSTSWRLTRDEPGWIEVTCELRHEDGHCDRVSMGGPPDTGGAKNAIQARASTISYLERYTLKAITGVAEGGDDDDGQGGTDYSAEAFSANLPAWSELILSGRKTADQIIATVETKGAPLTAQQKADLRSVAA